MKYLFIPYELAVIAKEKGFNEPCLGMYSEKLDFTIFNKNKDRSKPIIKLNLGFLGECQSEPYNWNKTTSQTNTKYYSALMYQQIVDWFREKHNIEVSYPIRKTKDKGVFWGGFIKRFDEEFGKSYGSNFTDYYEALNKAIEEAFKLI